MDHELPKPDVDSELLEMSKLAEIDTNGLAPGEASAVALSALHEMIARTHDLKRRVAVRAIDEGSISQAKAARLIGVHRLTMHRWYNQAVAEAAEDTPGES